MIAETTMRTRMLLAVTGIFWFAAVTAAVAANTEADFKAALSAAEAADKDAGALKNQWTTTEDALAAARKAAVAGDFDTAVNDAKQAEALAKASIAQAQEQQQAWRAGIIR
jgi:hypothetical protein